MRLLTHIFVSSQTHQPEAILEQRKEGKQMTTYASSHGGWNLFARVLQEIPAAHGYGLGYLDDRTDIHPEKVRCEGKTGSVGRVEKGNHL